MQNAYQIDAVPPFSPDRFCGNTLSENLLCHVYELPQYYPQQISVWKKAYPDKIGISPLKSVHPAYPVHDTIYHPEPLPKGTSHTQTDTRFSSSGI